MFAQPPEPRMHGIRWTLTIVPLLWVVIDRTTHTLIIPLLLLISYSK